MEISTEENILLKRKEGRKEEGKGKERKKSKKGKPARKKKTSEAEARRCLGHRTLHLSDWPSWPLGLRGGLAGQMGSRLEGNEPSKELR